jgi:MerR family mercuric resistance operon transcriptional regulator
MTIGRLARAAGVNVETIRYYQRRGLVPEPDRPLGGQRRYPRSVLERIAFIRRAQRLGFSLEEVRRLIELDGSRRSPESRLLAERKLAVVETRIAELHAMRRKLKALVAASRRNPRAGSCPILAALREDDASDV